MAIVKGNSTELRVSPPVPCNESLCAISSRVTVGRRKNRKATKASNFVDITSRLPTWTSRLHWTDALNEPNFIDWMQPDLDVSKVSHVEKLIWLAGTRSPAKPLLAECGKGEHRGHWEAHYKLCGTHPRCGSSLYPSICFVKISGRTVSATRASLWHCSQISVVRPWLVRSISEL